MDMKEDVLLLGKVDPILLARMLVSSELFRLNKGIVWRKVYKHLSQRAHVLRDRWHYYTLNGMYPQEHLDKLWSMSEDLQIAADKVEEKLEETGIKRKERP